MGVESVAVPITHTAAVRMPAMMTGIANGNSTLNRRCACVMPTPRAASFTASSTPNIPVTVFRRIGKML